MFYIYPKLEGSEMDNEKRIKQLKKELIEIEGREIKNVEGSSSSQIGSGFVIIGVGIVALTIGAVNAIFWLLIVGPITMMVGILMMSNAKSNLKEFEQSKRQREEQVMKIKREIIDLE